MPLLGHHGEKLQRLVAFDFGIDLVQQGCQFRRQLFAVLRVIDLLPGLLAQLQHGVAGRPAQARHAGQFHMPVGVEQVLDGNRRHILALAGFEQLLDPPGDAQQAVFGVLAAVAGLEKAVRRIAGGGHFRLLVIAQHVPRRLDFYLPAGADTGLDIGPGGTHVAGPAPLGGGHMGIAEVLGHAVAFDDVQAEAVVPLDQVGGQWRRAAADHTGLRQAQAGAYFLAYDAVYQRYFQQSLQFSLGKFPQYAGVKLQPQARHRNKQGGSCPLQILHEGIQAVGEKDMHPGVEGTALHHSALHDVGQRQVGQDAIGRGNPQLTPEALAGNGTGTEAVHDPLGSPGAARGVADERQIPGPARGVVADGLVPGHDIVPARVAGGRCQRQSHAR